jgi:hypothetical protein
MNFEELNLSSVPDKPIEDTFSFEAAGFSNGAGDRLKLELINPLSLAGRRVLLKLNLKVPLPETSNHMTEEKLDAAVEDIERRREEQAWRFVRGWNLIHGPGPIKPTPENVQGMLAAYPRLRDLINAVVNARLVLGGNFSATSESGPATEDGSADRPEES